MTSCSDSACCSGGNGCWERKQLAAQPATTSQKLTKCLNEETSGMDIALNYVLHAALQLKCNWKRQAPLVSAVCAWQLGNHVGEAVR